MDAFFRNAPCWTGDYIFKRFERGIEMVTTKKSIFYVDFYSGCEGKILFSPLYKFCKNLWMMFCQMSKYFSIKSTFMRFKIMYYRGVGKSAISRAGVYFYIPQVSARTLFFASVNVCVRESLIYRLTR